MRHSATSGDVIEPGMKRSHPRLTLSETSAPAGIAFFHSAPSSARRIASRTPRPAYSIATMDFTDSRLALLEREVLVTEVAGDDGRAHTHAVADHLGVLVEAERRGGPARDDLAHEERLREA